MYEQLWRSKIYCSVDGAMEWWLCRYLSDVLPCGEEKVVKRSLLWLRAGTMEKDVEAQAGLVFAVGWNGIPMAGNQCLDILDVPRLVGRLKRGSLEGDQGPQGDEDKNNADEKKPGIRVFVVPVPRLCGQRHDHRASPFTQCRTIPTTGEFRVLIIAIRPWATALVRGGRWLRRAGNRKVRFWHRGDPLPHDTTTMQVPAPSILMIWRFSEAILGAATSSRGGSRREIPSVRLRELQRVLGDEVEDHL
ncbi:MAG: hypothetical protein ACRD6W_01690, partial [Nitrososphaerales archaeon]